MISLINKKYQFIWKFHHIHDKNYLPSGKRISTEIGTYIDDDDDDDEMMMPFHCSKVLNEIEMH